MRKRGSTVYLPISILKEIDLLIERLGYWPSRAAFTREACLAKIKEYKAVQNAKLPRGQHVEPTRPVRSGRMDKKRSELTQ